MLQDAVERYQDIGKAPSARTQRLLPTRSTHIQVAEFSEQGFFNAIS